MMQALLIALTSLLCWSSRVLSASDAPTLSPTAVQSFEPQYVDFGASVMIDARRNKMAWMGNSAIMCHDFDVKRFSVLSMHTIIQSPTDEFMNLIVYLQHRRTDIIPERTFLKLTIREGEYVHFNEEQQLFEETALLRHYEEPFNTEDEVKDEMKIGLQVNFIEKNIPLGNHYNVTVEVGVLDSDLTSTRAHDCVVLRGIGTNQPEFPISDL